MHIAACECKSLGKSLTRVYNKSPEVDTARNMRNDMHVIAFFSYTCVSRGWQPNMAICYASTPIDNSLSEICGFRYREAYKYIWMDWDFDWFLLFV